MRKTKNIFNYVRLELELALELGLPIIVGNLITTNRKDNDRCPAIIRDACAIHIPYTLEALKYAMAHWPAGFRGLNATDKAAGWRYYEIFDPK